MDEFDELDDKQMRKDERMANCGKLITIQEKPNGGRILTYWRCKDPRCEYCNEIKGRKLKERVVRSIESTLTGMVILPGELATKLCRKLGKDHYLKIPKNDAEDYLFYDVNVPEDQALYSTDLGEIDWTEIAKRKTSKIISGNLGKETFPTEDDSVLYVPCQHIVAGPVDAAKKALFKAQTSMFAWSQPETLFESIQMRSAFNAHLVSILLNDGCRIFAMYHDHIYAQDYSLNFLDLTDKLEEEKIPI